MSRIGKKPVEVPKGVTVKVDGSSIHAKGPKGELAWGFHPKMSVSVDGSVITVTRPDDSKYNKALHGATRALIQNMIVGVSTGYRRTLDMVGVGYRAELKGKNIELAVGYSHPVLFSAPPGVKLDVIAKENRIVIEGVDKQAVGEAAARIRAVRPPEPYKGKGIKYTEEVIQRKAGKTAGA